MVTFRILRPELSGKKSHRNQTGAFAYTALRRPPTTLNTALDDLWTPRHYGELSRRLRDVQQRGPRQRVGVVANMRGINPLQHDCARVVIYGDDSGRHAAK